MESGLVRDALDAHAAYFCALTQRGGGTVVAYAGVLSWCSRHPMGFLVNGVLRTDSAVDPAAVIGAADERFAGAYEVVTLVGRDDDLLDYSIGIGLDAGGHDPIQVLSSLDALPDRDVPVGIELRVVTDAAGVADVALVNQAATVSYGFPDDLFPTVFAEPATVLADDIFAVVAYEDDAPVATAQVFRHGATAYVGWVATAATTMRRGLGTTLTNHVVRHARGHGAKVATLMASPMGAPVYRRMGFVDVASLRSAARTRTA